MENFTPVVNISNILEIPDAPKDAIYRIERNGNYKISLTDLPNRLTRLYH